MGGCDSMLEKMAQAMADQEYRARIQVIRASQNTDRPISVPGPFDGLDYLLSAAQWERAGSDHDVIKNPYRAMARAAVQAIREPSDDFMRAMYPNRSGQWIVTTPEVAGNRSRRAGRLQIARFVDAILAGDG